MFSWRGRKCIQDRCILQMTDDRDVPLSTLSLLTTSVFVSNYINEVLYKRLRRPFSNSARSQSSAEKNVRREERL